jgi:hypothetical protein
VESSAGTGKELHEFERTYFDKLRLAAQVILNAAPDLELITDPLEAELHIFKDRVEFLLLLPEYAASVIPWRAMLDGHRPPSREGQPGDGGPSGAGPGPG